MTRLLPAHSTITKRGVTEVLTFFRKQEGLALDDVVGLALLALGRAVQQEFFSSKKIRTPATPICSSGAQWGRPSPVRASRPR